MPAIPKCSVADEYRGKTIRWKCLLKTNTGSIVDYFRVRLENIDNICVESEKAWNTLPYKMSTTHIFFFHVKIL